MKKTFMRELMIIGTALVAAVSIVACKPTYEAPVDAPDMTTLPADAPYDIDFVQLNNDVIDSLSLKRDVFSFIKSLEIDGSNADKNIELDIDIQKGVSVEAVQILLSEVTKRIADNAYIQDFRLKKSDDTQFGSVFDIYNYTFKVTSDGVTLYDKTIAAGSEIPLDPATDGDTVKTAIEQIENDKLSADGTTGDASN